MSPIELVDFRVCLRISMKRLKPEKRNLKRILALHPLNEERKHYRGLIKVAVPREFKNVSMWVVSEPFRVPTKLDKMYGSSMT